MGLDMYAYVAGNPKRSGQAPDPIWNGHRELAYWRKHPNLHGWFKKLWESRGNSGKFNGVEVELTWKDLEKLEDDIKNDRLWQFFPEHGYFFGVPSDDYYREQDLQFVTQAKAELFFGLRVFYNSSW